MRAAVLLCLVSLVAALAPSATAAQGMIDIRATIVTEIVAPGDARRSYFLRLWERDRQHPIGTAFGSCLVVGRNDQGYRVWGCNAAYKLPRGQITASGIITSFDRLGLAITGGTRHYIGQGGESFTYRIGPGEYRVLMRLVP